MKTEFESLTLADVADYFRNKYPNAVSISFFVNHEEHELSIKEKDTLDGYSMKMLNGEQAKGYKA